METLIIDNSNFIRLENVRNATITTTSFINGQIGPILIVEQSSLLIKSSTFVNTTITDKRVSSSSCNGAAIYCSMCSLTVIQSNFSQNRVRCTFFGDGGAIYAIFTNVDIRGSIFSDNLSLDSGGALYIAHGSLKSLNSLFMLNSAKTGGAIVYSSSGDSIYIHNSTFSNNVGVSGEAMYACYRPPCKFFSDWHLL